MSTYMSGYAPAPVTSVESGDPNEDAYVAPRAAQCEHGPEPEYVDEPEWLDIGGEA